MAVQFGELGIQITVPGSKEGEEGENGKKAFVCFKDIYNRRAHIHETEKGREFLNFLFEELKSIWLMFGDETKLVSDLEDCVARLQKENCELRMAQPGEQFQGIDLQDLDILPMNWQSFDYSALDDLGIIHLPPDESQRSSL